MLLLLARCMADPSVPVVVQVVNQYIPQYIPSIFPNILVANQNIPQPFFNILSTCLINHLDPTRSLPPSLASFGN